MRTEILQLKDLGRMPNESINDPDNIVEVIRSYDELLKRIQLPISFDEAEVLDRKSTRLNSSHASKSRMPSSA